MWSMQNKRDSIRSSPKQPLTRGFLRSLLKQIGNLNRTGMRAGNAGEFDMAFLNIEEALSLSQDLGKKCLEAKLLNNLGNLYTMNGTWDKAMETYDRSMSLVTRHYGTQNILYKTLQKNIGYLFDSKRVASR